MFFRVLTPVFDILREHEESHRIYFLQDGHPAHTSAETVAFIQENWDPNRVISLSSPQSRRRNMADFAIKHPSYSPDLATCDWWWYPLSKRKHQHLRQLSQFIIVFHYFFFTGKVYLHPRPQNTQQIKQKIVALWDSITPAKLESLNGAYMRRIQKCLDKNGGLFEK